jgi:bifunctional UDP-N-acetylglucosamine pyrophosphorylase / glucosamine-1-phosphate N-acetyltransferase
MAAVPTVVILAAGQGTRMRSSTPKVLHELCGQPMVLWPVRAALTARAGRVVVVDSPERRLREALPDGVELVVQPQSDGTGGAIRAAIDAIDPAAPVVVLSGDVPLISAQAIGELVSAHVDAAAAATVVTTVLDDDPQGYGRVVRAADGSVLRVAETKIAGDASAEELQIREVSTGIYAFDGKALLSALPRLTAENAQGELYLPQVLGILRTDGAAVLAHVIEDDRLVLGVNDRVALAQVRAIAQRAICERHMRAGVTIVDPASTVIDVDVEIGQDALIEPGSALKGSTVVHAGAIIGPHATVIDCRIGERACVRASWLEQAVLHAEVTVGPFAHLRPGAELYDGAKAGTFVEIKNSQVGAHTKIPHLSYIGDADIGEHSNLGAGTITANYDGRVKHRTTIGNRVRGGVDTSFVAPVTIGDDVYTAAGSVITEDVPPGALGVARTRQRNVEGYNERAEGGE